MSGSNGNYQGFYTNLNKEDKLDNNARKLYEMINDFGHEFDIVNNNKLTTPYRVLHLSETQIKYEVIELLIKLRDAEPENIETIRGNIIKQVGSLGNTALSNTVSGIFVDMESLKLQKKDCALYINSIINLLKENNVGGVIQKLKKYHDILIDRLAQSQTI